jgi:signal transduction histidine kinase
VLKRGTGIAIAGVFCTLVQGTLWSQDAALASANLAASLLFAFTGLLLLDERSQRGTAWALILAGVFRSVDFSDLNLGHMTGPLDVYGLIFGGVDRLFGAYAVLRYPNSSLLRYQRVYLAALTLWMLVGRTLITVTSTAAWNGDQGVWWPTLLPDLGLANALNIIVNAGEGLFGVALVALLIIRIMRTKGLDRIVITPVIVAGIAGVFAASASAVAQIVVSPAAGPTEAYLIESAVDMTIPLAFLIAAIQRTLLFRSIPGLAAQISADADVGAVRDALQSTLHDPTLDVIDLTDPDDERSGATIASLDTDWPDRLVQFVHTAEGNPIAVVIADPALARYRGLFDTAVQTSGLALKNAQLQAQAAREKLREVHASRARIVEASLAERRRLERDLHDGVQQHILGLAARLAAAMMRTSDPVAVEAFAQAREGLNEVLAGLRDLAHGIHPAVLTQGGLVAALEEVAERLPLRVQLSGPEARLAPAVEAAAYFAACEALTNVVKHAEATSATVTINVDDSHLDMKIIDNGIGGASLGGHGLANIVDRVSAVDGDVIIESPPGGGTRLAVRIPCG